MTLFSSRRRRAISGLFTVAALGAIALVLLIGRPVAQSTTLAQVGDEAGYRFFNITAQYAENPLSHERDTSQATITFNYSWTTAGYAGSRRCSVVVFDSSGQVVGQEEWTSFSGTNPGAVEPTSVNIAVHGAPSYAEINCFGARLDATTSEAHLAASDVRVSAPTTRKALLSFHVEWAGPGVPGPQVCKATIFDKAGGEVHAEEFMVDLMDGTPLDASVELSSLPTLTKSIGAADITCRPFDG